MLSEKEKLVIKAMCDNGLSQERAARAMFHHRNTIYYQRRKIKAKTGLDICNFYDAVKLLAMSGERDAFV